MVNGRGYTESYLPGEPRQLAIATKPFAHHCDELQGHYFSKALSATEFAKLLRGAKKVAV